MYLSQLRHTIVFTIAFTLVSLATVSGGEPKSHKLAEQSSPQHTAEEELANASRYLTVWLEEMSEPVRRTDIKIETSASCAATACHGGPRPSIASHDAIRGAEYPLWLENDPHAQSWRSLCSEESLTMLERLNIIRDGSVVNLQAFNNCLACHTTARGSAAASELNHSGVNSEGVGCASCHGPSQNWRGDHYRLQRDDASSAAKGLAPTKDLFVRARVCASCHVGDSDRDMNHDIIAAGHPALHYEFATFHNMLPKHWREPEKTRSSDFEAKLWLAGQVAALDASLALLDSRANRHLSVSTWPEFATTDCSSCHQNLRLGAGDYARGNRPSANTYSSWNRFGVEQLLSQPGIEVGQSIASQRLVESLNHLSDLMSTRAIPDAGTIQVAARNARLDLDAWQGQSAQAVMLQFSVGNLQRVATTALADTDRLKGWEFTAQSYLAVIAARNSWMSDTSASATADASQLRNAILFKPGASSLALLDEPDRDIQTTVARLLQSLEQGSRIPATQSKSESPPKGKTPARAGSKPRMF